MENSQSETFVNIVKGLLSEAYEGVNPGKPVWFSDAGEGSGLFRTLERLSPETASKPLLEGSSTIAAHAEHLRWSLALTNAYARGQAPAKIAWAESWTVKTVDPSAWEDLKSRLHAEYQTVVTHLPPQPDLSNPIFVTSAVAMVAHAAYHLSAIRQMLTVLEPS